MIKESLINLMQQNMTLQLHLYFQIFRYYKFIWSINYYAHEIGTDQVNSSGTTSINAFIRSGDFDIDDGELFMS